MCFLTLNNLSSGFPFKSSFCYTNVDVIMSSTTQNLWNIYYMLNCSQYFGDAALNKINSNLSKHIPQLQASDSM